MTPRAVQLESRAVGNGGRTYIIAEAGVNHDGNPAQAMRLIEAAKLAGADAIQFPFFTADRLLAGDAANCDEQQRLPGAPVQRALLKALALPPETFVTLHRRARETEIDFLVTPFGRAELRYLVDEVGVRVFPIASPDAANLPLLDDAVATGLPLVVSTGAADECEIEQLCVGLSRGGADDRLVLMHCVFAHRDSGNDLRLGRIRALADRVRVPVGFRDHTLEDNTSYAAVVAGACVLEKRFTLHCDAAGPDHVVSLEPAAFCRYIDAARHAETLLGEHSQRSPPEEEQARALARGRIVASRAIRAGEKLTPENLTVQRNGAGVSPLRWDEFIGQRIRADVSAGMPLSDELLARDDAAR